MNTKARISSVLAILTITITTSANVYALPSASGAAGGMGHGSSAGYGGSSSSSSSAGSNGAVGSSSSEGQSGQSSGLSYQPYTNNWTAVDHYIAECKANGVTIGRYAALHVDIECAGD